jgi:hypothetical protein
VFQLNDAQVLWEDTTKTAQNVFYSCKLFLQCVCIKYNALEKNSIAQVYVWLSHLPNIFHRSTLLTILQKQQLLLLLLFNKTLNFHDNFSPCMIFRWYHQLIIVRVKRDEETDLISTLRIHFMHFVRKERKKN